MRIQNIFDENSKYLTVNIQYLFNNEITKLML